MKVYWAKSKTKVKEIIKLRKNGYSYHKIAYLLKISSGTAHRYCKMNGIQ
jgi:DNA-binding CsgD family transcriptional regulator